jgi:hypothetical protein
MMERRRADVHSPADHERLAFVGRSVALASRRFGVKRTTPLSQSDAALFLGGGKGKGTYATPWYTPKFAMGF